MLPRKRRPKAPAGIMISARTSRAGELSSTAQPAGLPLPPRAPRAGAFLLSPALSPDAERASTHRSNRSSRSIEVVEAIGVTERRHMANAEKVTAVTELTERFKG